MPAAAVIPAPIAYIKVVAVKKLVVGFRSGPVGPPGVAVSVLVIPLAFCVLHVLIFCVFSSGLAARFLLWYLHELLSLFLVFVTTGCVAALDAWPKVSLVAE